MDDQLKEAIGLAAEISKQLITLSTGMLVITITFASSIARHVTPKNRRILIASWFVFLATIVVALWHLSALTGNLLRRPIDPSLDSALSPALIQLVVFVSGILLFVIFALRTERRDQPPREQLRDDILP